MLSIKLEKKILISAFGATEFPTTEGRDAIKVARDLAKFCIDNKFDGVDIDWEDNGAMEIGTGE
jgi:GH18 family chitinase